MVDAAASILFNVIFDKLADEALKKYVRSQGIHEELENWGAKLSLIQDVLSDASDKEITEKPVKKWLNKLQHVAYDIDDVLDDVATEAMRHDSGASSSKVRKFVPTCCTNFSLSHRLSPKLDDITTQLNDLYEERSGLGLIVKDEKQKDPNRGNETSLPEPKVVGREGEKKKLLNKLLADDDQLSSKENFSVVPIFGMGGVGKTTLARLLYNDTKVKSHFELRAWVCVSDDFDVFKISQTILQDVNRGSTGFNDLNQVQKALSEQFEDKRFLLVIDDVWTEKYDDWEKLVRPFHSGAVGSRVIITTRKKQLLERVGFGHLDLLESLSFEDALSLFALNALGEDSFKSYPTLREKGEAIVKKCGTLPLALKAIGRLLRTKSEEKWDDVLNSNIWDSKYVGDLSEDWKAIFPALMLSYHDLDANLKRLFAYCSLFPKDYLFDKEELVLLWMAEGFVYQSNANKSQECFGQEYFEALLSRSFFQHAPNDESLYVMHDLLNDLATFVAKDFFLRFENISELGEAVLTKYHHMSFITKAFAYESYQKFEPFKRARNLRTLLAVSVDQSLNIFFFPNKILADLLPQLPLLRVLSLRGSHISEAPDSIGSLKHLRYLNLSQTKIVELPENIGNLFNLQTLIVYGCTRLKRLPESFIKLKNIRHFDMRKTTLRIGELKSLQTLTKIIIGGQYQSFAITELEGLNNVEGELCINGLCEVQSSMHAHEAKLSLKRLTKLELDWRSDMSDSERAGLRVEEEVLKELKPNSEWLKKLSINNYLGIEFPKWVGDPSFHQLVQVSISGCKNCTSLPSLGQLPSLKELFISEMDNVRFIGSELTGSNQLTVDAFPSLEILSLEKMQEWELWSNNNEVFDSVFPSLQKIQLEDSPKLIEVPLKTLLSFIPCLQELHIESCPKLVNISAGGLPFLRVLKIAKCSDYVLTSLVRAASSMTKLEISDISGLTYEVWRGVTEHIRAVEEVRIERCDELKYLWESEEEASKVLVNIKELRVHSCSNLVSLGEKEEDDNFQSSLLSSLRMLYVSDCDKMERCCCPNGIESLKIRKCSSLTHVSFPTAATGEGGQKLKSFEIWNCEKLMEKINNTISMPMLESISTYGWSNLKSIMQFGNFNYLAELRIHNCPSIASFPDIHLPVLTSLMIRECESMASFSALQMRTNLPLLKELEIVDCPSIDPSCHGGVWPPNLCSLEIGRRLKKPMSEWGPQSFPTSLVDLTLYGGEGEHHVSNFKQLSHLFPSSLTKLQMYGFEKLESLSMGLQHLTSLQHLTISICPKLKHLPKHLTSLQHLRIWNCPKLKHLPKQLLPSLLSLEIVRCPDLRKRCEGRGSHYYPLISHIPYIEFRDF